ncbi:SMC-Scp complex subunit ScpB [Candidatus Woesearchaeota archaeon]|nr:SMC-Scp complex subunit ScpB [Candidatus Woesearchaeota archaeon]
MDENLQEERNKVEAILFTTGRFMTLQEVADLCGIGSVGIVKELIGSLQKDYDSKPGALAVLEDGGKYKLSIRKKYNYLTTKLLDVTELDKPTQETLAVIAYKQPAIQADVIRIRGNKAYDHIEKLKELGFVTSDKYGRTRLLKLTQKFFDYFDLVEDHLKEKFANLAKLEEQTKELEKQLGEPAPAEQSAPQEEQESAEQPPQAPEEENPREKGSEDEAV